MIFKTIDDETAISGQRIVGALQARKIAQQQATAQLEVDIACLKKYEIACQSGSVSTEQFDSIMKKASVSAKEYTTNIQKGTGSAQSYAQAQKANNAALQSVGAGAGVASKAVKLLSATMNTIAFTAIFSLISKGISWATEQIDNYIHRNEIAIEKAEELLNTFKSETDTITANQDKINGYADEFKELSEGVDDLGRNVSLTADEYARYQSIVKEIVGINPSLISGYDEENNILADKNGLIETSIQLLKDEYNQKLKNLALPDNVDTAIEGAVGRYNTAKEDFLKFEIPTTLAFSGVKIDENGNRETGYVNQISQYIEDVIGVEFDGWEGGINQYILDNAEAVFDNLDKIKERASQTKDGWEGLNDSQLIDLMDYFKELRIAYNDMNNATTSANPTLQYVAMAEDSYSQLTDVQKKFIADYVNGIKITSETTEQEKDNIRKSIISITQELSNLDDTDINNALADLYAIPTDEQSIGEFVEQFRSALEIIKVYCEENGIEIPIAISDSEQTVNDLEAQYQRAVDFVKDKFNGYDPTAFFKENSINTQEEVDKWLEIAQAANSAAEAEKKYVQGSTPTNNPDTLNLQSWLSTSNSESGDSKNSDLIDNYESQIDTIKKRLAELSSTTQADLYELAKTFNDTSFLDINLNTDNGLEQLRLKLAELSNKECQNLIKALENVEDSTAKEKLLDYIKQLNTETSSLVSVINGVDPSILAKGLKDITVEDSVNAINDIQQSMNALDTAYAEFKNADVKNFSIGALSGLSEQFGNLAIFDEVVAKMDKVNVSSKDIQQAFNDLATAYVYQSGILDTVNDETAKQIEYQLKQMGVSNANAIVTAKLAAQQLVLKVNMEGTTEEISQQISDLLNHGEASGAAASALFDLIAQEKIFNETSLSVEDKIKDLEKLAIAFGIATAPSSNAWSIDKQLEYGKVSEEQLFKNRMASYKRAMEKQFGSLEIKTVNYTGGTVTNPTPKKSSKKEKKPKKEKKSKKKKNSTSEVKDSKQTIDWISRKFDILTKQLDVIKKKASEVYSTFKNQNTQLDLAIENIEKQIPLYKKAYTAYMKQADKVSAGLSDSIKKKVQNGSISITDYSDNTAKKIQEYQKYYDLAQDTQKTVTELKLEEKELARQKLSNITDDYDRKKSYQEALANLREAKAGDNLTEKDYNYLIKKQNHIKSNLKKEQKDLEKEFNALVENGTIKKYSDAWYEWKEKIVGVKVGIEDCNNEIEGFAESIIDLRWEKFDKAIESLDTISGKLSNIKNFFDGDLFNGASITKAGLANVALGFADMGNEKQRLVNYQAEKNRLNTMLSNKKLTDAEKEKYEERLKEIEKLEIESALNIKNARQSIIDIYVQSIEAETDAMHDLIESKKDALQTEKD